MTYRWQAQNFLFDFFFIWMANPWNNTALKALLVFNEFLLLFVEFAKNILQSNTFVKAF